MKRAMKYFGHFLCTLALIVCLAQPVSAADETNYFDCTVFHLIYDSRVCLIVWVHIREHILPVQSISVDDIHRHYLGPFDSLYSKVDRIAPVFASNPQFR